MMNKKKYARIGIVILVLILGLLFIKPHLTQTQPAPASGQTLEKYLPDNTLLLLTFPDLKAAHTALQKTGLYKIWQEEEVQQLWQSLRANLEPFLKQLENELGLTIDEIAGLFNAELSLAIIDLPFNRQSKFDFVMALGTGETKDKLETLLTWFKKNLLAGPGGQVAKAETYQFKNVTIQNLKVFYLAYLDHTLLLTNQKERMENLITYYQDKPQTALTNSPVFTKAQAKVEGEKSAVMFYFNLAEIFKRCAEMIPPEAKQFMDTLGLMDIESLAASVVFQDDGLVKEEFYVVVPADKRKGVMKLFDDQKTCELNLNLVPQHALAYSSVRLDIGKIWSGVLTFLKSLPEAEMEIANAIKALEEKLGFSIKDDLCASVEDNFVSYSIFPEAGGIFPDQVSMVPLKDQAKFEQCLAQIAEATQLPVKEIPFKGQAIKCAPALVNLFTQDQEMGQPGGMGSMAMGSPFALLFSSSMQSNPYYFIKDNLLYFSENIHSLKRAIIWLGQERTTLDSNPKFKNMASLIPQNAQLVVYSDSENLFNSFYNTLIPLGQTLVKAFSQFAPIMSMGDPQAEMIMTMVNDVTRQLPLGETIGQHLGQTVGSLRYDPDGIKIEGHSKTGCVSIMAVPAVAAVAIVAAIAIPNLLTSKLSANEASAIGGLRMLVSVEATWMQMDPDGNGKDFWTGDISCFYRARPNSPYIDIAFAKADANPLLEGKEGSIGHLKIAALGETTPKSGYLYRVMRLDADGTPYQQDPDGDGDAVSNRNYYAFVAYPAEYGKTGVRTFIIDQGGTVYCKDLGPMPMVEIETVAAAITPETEKEIDELITQLADESSDVREDATNQLIQFGQPVIEYLAKAKKHEDPEVRFRAEVIIKKLTEPEILPIEQWPAIDPMDAGWRIAD